MNKKYKIYEGYHFTKEYFEGLSLTDLLNLSNEEKIKLAKYFTEQLTEEGFDEVTVEEVEEYISKFKNQLLEDLKTTEKNLLNKNFSVNIYRGIKVVSEEDIWLDYLGVCWTTNKECAGDYTDIENALGAKYLVIFEGETSSTNIDWVESLLLYIIYGDAEHELRVKDSSTKKIYLKSYELETLQYTGDYEDDEGYEETPYIHKYIQGKELKDKIRKANEK